MPLDEGQLDQIGKFRLPTPVPPICPQCGYNLTGPERAALSGMRLRVRAGGASAARPATQWLEAMGLKTLPEEIEFGFRLAGIAWGVAILVFVGGTLIPWHVCSMRVLLMLMYAAEAFMAFCAAFLCSQVIRFQRLPCRGPRGTPDRSAYCQGLDRPAGSHRAADRRTIPLLGRLFTGS